jgi:alkylhydroperoxidase family enzyme
MALFGQVGRSALSTVGRQQVDDLSRSSVLFRHSQGRRAHTVTDEFFAQLKQVFSEEEIIEMVLACGIFNGGNKFNISMHMDSDEASEYASNMEYRQEKLA